MGPSSFDELEQSQSILARVYQPVSLIDGNAVQGVVDSKAKLRIIWLQDSALDQRHHADDGVKQ